VIVEELMKGEGSRNAGDFPGFIDSSYPLIDRFWVAESKKMQNLLTRQDNYVTVTLL
jgi:hypothetical protein